MNGNLKRRRFSRLVRALSLLLGLSILFAFALVLTPQSAHAWPGDLILVWSSDERDWTSSVAWGDWDNDGDPDLAVGNWRQNRLYRNEGGALNLIWSSDEIEWTNSVAWGDLNGDGNLDLAVGNDGWPNRVYTNTGDSENPLVLAWSAPITDTTTSVAWGDYDKDGNLDLAVGNGGKYPDYEPNRVYRNEDGSLTLKWSSTETDWTSSVAWGDWNNDGYPELAVGNNGHSHVYENEGGSLTLGWSSPSNNTRSVAWGDWDGDSDLDLAFGNWKQPNQVFRNIGEDLTESPAWVSPEEDFTRSLAWGDWDGDDDYDLAAGNEYGDPNRVYENLDGSLILAWTSLERDYTFSVAWADWDGDGDPDLAVGNSIRFVGQPNRVYANGNGDLNPVWLSPEQDSTFSTAWGDWDGDGDLDLAVGNGRSSRFGWNQPNQVYTNDQGILTLAWTSPESHDTRSVAWGDWDRDGDLDLAVGNYDHPNQVYANEGSDLVPVWSATATYSTTSVAWGDWNGDSDLDLAIGNYNHPNQVYDNEDSDLVPQWSATAAYSTTSVAWADWNGDGNLDLAVGNNGQHNRVYTSTGYSLVEAWSASEAYTTTSLAWGYWKDADDDEDNGKLALAVGNYDQPNRVYVSTESGGQYDLQLKWSSSEEDPTTSVAWGDRDGDGDLDLGVGNLGQPNRVYANVGDSLALAWASDEPQNTASISWGDWDQDGDLDLAVGNPDLPNEVYANNGRILNHRWSSPEINFTRSVAWGDWDGDGDLDLAVGNIGQASGVYTNTGDSLLLDWSTPITSATTGLAWGDWDGDGDLDLAVVADSQPNRVYTNTSNIEDPLVPVWSASVISSSTSVAWGDWDGDGDLDLAVGNDGPNQVYENTGDLDPQQRLALAWSSVEQNDTHSVAWGDWDGDGDLDLAVGNYDRPSRVYANQGATLTLAWSAPITDATRSLAWGDWDNDGDLDLAIGNQGPNRLYANTEDGLVLAWSSPQWSPTTGVAWHDWDGDGDLDLAVGNQGEPNQVYANQAGSLTLAWSSSEWDDTSSVAWGDWDGDGDPDLAVGNGSQPNRLYRNRSADQPALPDRATTARIATPGPPAAPFFSSATVLEGPTLPITYTLFDPEGHPARLVKAYYSLDGGSIWRPATSTPETITEDLAASPTGTVHTFTWDVYASGVFGASDSTVFRLDVYQGFAGPGPYQYVHRTARTLPFRLRGSQVRVLDAAGQPLANALVLRRPPAHSDFEFYQDNRGRPFQTNPTGYLLGRGELAIDDQLVTLAPVTATESYTLYHTSATPTLTGLDAYTVTAKGVQTLTISAEHPLVLFNLDIALEWDARNDERDERFIDQLENDLQEASETLYDWSNGQAALGRLRIFPDAKRTANSGQLVWQPWLDAHLRIYASNRLRPSAAQGGIVAGLVTETVALSATQVITYWPGQVHIGAIWNRDGSPGSDLGQDWLRVLAHELGHYALFLNDNYLGLDDDGLLIPVDACPGAMADPYTDADSEFHPAAGWLPDCQQTLSHQETGRADWQTIAHFYPDLHEPAVPFNAVLAGPSNLPLAVDHIEVIEPITPTETLPTFSFDLTDEEGRPYYPGDSARAFLFQGDDRLTDLGGPTGDRALVRGARPGDRLCLADLAARRLGCEEIASGDERLMLSETDWQPGVILTPITTRTLAITVTNVLTAEPKLHARLFPLNDPAAAAITLTLSGQDYTGVFSLTHPALEGYVHVWVDGASAEIVTDYTIGGSPGYRRGHGAPVMSADGQVVLFGQNLALAKGDLLIMQTATILPGLSPWLTAVGQGYWLAASPSVPDLDNASIAFGYLEKDLPFCEEWRLHIYFWDGVAWRQLPTALDTEHNFAAAPAQGPGLYALMITIEYPLYGPGWDDFPYTLDTRPIPQALQSIDGFYTQVCRFVAQNPPFDQWQCYNVGGPGWANELSELAYDSYWANVTEDVTLRLRCMADSATLAQRSLDPPATYYGRVLPGPGFTPAAGQPVTAWIGDNHCGQGQTLTIDDQVVYVVHVLAGSQITGCGTTARQITFRVDGHMAAQSALWDDSQAWELALSPLAQRLYAPLIVKP